jgi:hypothetical protein
MIFKEPLIHQYFYLQDFKDINGENKAFSYSLTNEIFRRYNEINSFSKFLLINNNKKIIKIEWNELKSKKY